MTSTRFSETLRGLVFWPLFYLWLLFGGLFLMPLPPISETWARRAVLIWTGGLWTLLRLVGVRVEVRGAAPEGRALLAAKHQSLLDVFMLFRAMEHPRFVMKRALAKTPIVGFFALRVGAVPVDRGGGKAAAQAMADALLKGRFATGQMVIYPQGTRVAPGAPATYKTGVWTLYEESGLPCHLAATNAGHRLPKGLRVRPGTAIVEFLEPIPPGLSRPELLARVERDLEGASRRLAEEAP